MLTTVITSGNLFPTVITSGNVFPTVISGGNVFATVVSTDDRPIERFSVELNFREEKMAIELFLQP